MSAYTITFRIANDSTYEDRYVSFVEELKKKVNVWWAEPTSFFAVETSESIDQFCERIYSNTKFDASKDLYLVLDANVKSGRVRGRSTDADLYKILPYVKKL